MDSTGTGPSTAVDGPLDRRGLHVLDLDTCLERLRSAPIGGVAFPERGEVVVLPVNHVMDGEHVAFRTTWGSKLHRAADGGSLSYEVDHYDLDTRCGWSVLVMGRAQVVRDEDAARLEAMAPAPWTRMADVSWVRILAEEISGREIAPDGAALDETPGG